MACAALLVRWTDTLRPPVDPNVVDESLYLNDKTARRISLGFNGLAADWYWMRSLQYVGKKMLNFEGDISLDDLSQLNMKLLAPLLDTATTLDPEFIAALRIRRCRVARSRCATGHSPDSKRHRCKSKRMEALSPSRLHLLASG